MPKCDFSKVVKQLYGNHTSALSNFIEVTIWHGCSPVNLLHIFRRRTFFFQKGPIFSPGGLLWQKTEQILQTSEIKAPRKNIKNKIIEKFPG